MIKGIGDIIINRIDGLPFIDKKAGIIRVLSVEENGKKKSFPASINLSPDQCNSSRYNDLLPDSKKKSVLYLEDKGTKLVETLGRKMKFKSSLNLVCWLNLPKIGYEGSSYTAAAIAAIISRIPESPFSAPGTIYNAVAVSFDGQEPNTVNPFQRYANEEITQYLMYPYDYFVLNLSVEFIIMRDCLTALPIDEEKLCIKA